VSFTYEKLATIVKEDIIPLKAIIMNVASLCATFGILVWLFQGGHFGLEPASIGLMIPVLIFGIVFGLSMDYEVFLISRMHEIYTHTKDNDFATLEGLISTSKLITSAATIIIVITGAFAFTDVVPVKQIGIGIALAILIDATIVRMVLVPSLMKLLGKWNWWSPSLFKKTRE
jgi:RND superfamily putative drug exporter